MNRRIVMMAAMLPTGFAGFLLAGGGAESQTDTPIVPLSVIPGPVEADVLKITDGDTLKVVAYPWPEVATIKDVRIRGIDTAEIHGKCQYEKDMAAAAKSFVTDLINKNRKRVKLLVVGCSSTEGAGFGRCLADVHVGSVPIAGALTEKGLARTNTGEKRQGWCPAPP